MVKPIFKFEQSSIWLLFEMCILVSTIYYEYLNECIEIYWDNSNVLVHNAGMWFHLPDMTIRNVIASLGFQNNRILSSRDVLQMYVSSAPTNIITIVNKPYVEKYNATMRSKGCIQSIMSKIENFILS